MKAILLCAGMGTRFRPLSLTCPKQLVPINGMPLVEHTISFLHRHEVTDITLVTGYLAGNFAYLKDKYGVDIRFNSDFAESGNGSSLALAADKLDGALVIDGDLVILRDVFIQISDCRSKIGPGKSFFVSQKTERGLEWELCLDQTPIARVDEPSPWTAKRIESVRIWSPSGFAMTGCSYWEGEAAALLAGGLPGKNDDYGWENAAIRIMPQCPLYALCLEEPYAVELDSVKEALDYRILSHEEVAEICSQAPPVKLKGLTNSTWKISAVDESFKVLRIPGPGTEHFIKREEEPKVLALIGHMDITPRSEFFPDGFKLSDFLPRHRVSGPEDMNEVFFARLAACLGKMHAVHYRRDYGLEPVGIAHQMDLYESQSAYCAPPPFYDWLRQKAGDFEREACVLCHRDLLLENIMVLDEQGGGMQLIDFEYAGFTHPYWDFASFILESGIRGGTRKDFMRVCGIAGGKDEDRLLEMEILQDYIWGMWGLVNRYQAYAETRLKRALDRLAGLIDIDLPFILPLPAS